MKFLSMFTKLFNKASLLLTLQCPLGVSLKKLKFKESSNNEFPSIDKTISVLTMY